ncbi:MAG: exodeoxyribonuclease III [Beijerinckiaceae bacterium]
MAFSLATWNINSVRLRIGLVARFLQENKPDILCLQETKCRDSEFPAAEFQRLGYTHIATNGQKGYHGVAIVSRLPIETVSKREFCQKGDARHISVTLAAGIAGSEPWTVHNFYVPAGGDEPDPEINDKFAHKLAFLEEMTGWFGEGSMARAKAILVGDLNIAPLEQDVWSHKALLSVVSHTPVEVASLARVLGSGPWIDAMRAQVPHHEKLYTWWSYRSPDWAAADRGRRLDHIWLSELASSHRGPITVHKDARAWEKPSDHVPVTISLVDA